MVKMIHQKDKKSKFRSFATLNNPSFRIYNEFVEGNRIIGSICCWGSELSQGQYLQVNRPMLCVYIYNNAC